MKKDSPSSWPNPPQYVAKNWPNGFSEKDSEEFKIQVSKWASVMCDSIACFLERELSMMDRRDITRHTGDVLREFFSGSYALGPYEEISSRYFLGLAGYMPEEAEKRIFGITEDTWEQTRVLFHRLHARAHHE